MQHIPGAESVAVASDLPATYPGSVTLQIGGQPEVPVNERPSALEAIVTSDYFRVTGIPLLRGRTFTEMDNANAPQVVVVSHEFVHRLLKDREPLGQRIRLDIAGLETQWSEIIGVVADVKTHSEDSRIDPQVYEPFFQHPINSFSVLLSAHADPNHLASALRSTVAQLDTELPLDRVLSMPDLIERQKAGNPLFVRILWTFSTLALFLAAIGIYGLVSYSVGQRTHEIAIRMALGAKTRDMLRLVLWQGLRMAAAGAAIGFLLALPLPKLFHAIFYDASSLDFRSPWLFAFMPLMVLVVAMLATYVPAHRASRVDPMSALRQE